MATELLSQQYVEPLGRFSPLLDEIAKGGISLGPTGLADSEDSLQLTHQELQHLLDTEATPAEARAYVRLGNVTLAKLLEFGSEIGFTERSHNPSGVELATPFVPYQRVDERTGTVTYEYEAQLAVLLTNNTSASKLLASLAEDPRGEKPAIASFRVMEREADVLLWSAVHANHASVHNWTAVAHEDQPPSVRGSDVLDMLGIAARVQYLANQRAAVPVS